jgi:hypothetical protein
MSKPSRPIYRDRPRLAPWLRVAGSAPIRSEAHAPVAVRAAAEVRAEDGSALESNTFCGNPSIMGRAYPIGWGDGEVIFPGAFTDSLPDFLASGFMADSHDWSALPTGYITVAEERGSALYCEVEFHNHPEAIAQRDVIAQRLAAGKKVHLSIGFYLDSDSYFWFESGEKLLGFAKDNGYDMARFDAPQIKAWDGWILGVTKVHQLIEFSRVYRGANDAAEAEEVLGQSDDAPEVTPPAEDVPPTGTRQEIDPATTQRIRELRAAALLGETA